MRLINGSSQLGPEAGSHRQIFNPSFPPKSAHASVERRVTWSIVKFWLLRLPKGGAICLVKPAWCLLLTRYTRIFCQEIPKKFHLRKCLFFPNGFVLKRFFPSNRLIHEDALSFSEICKGTNWFHKKKIIYFTKF